MAIIFLQALLVAGFLKCCRVESGDSTPKSGLTKKKRFFMKHRTQGRKSVDAQDFDNLYEEYKSVLKQKEILGEQIELASQSSADLQSHIDQSQEEFKMYEDEIRNLREDNKLLLGKYKKLKISHEKLKNTMNQSEGENSRYLRSSLGSLFDTGA